jgi:Cd2+/Zn2+-exporting ATPase/Cu+-exporting ATPase
MNQATPATAEADPRSGHAEPQNPEHGHEGHDHSLAWVDLVRIGLVAVAVVASWFGLWKSLAGLLGLGEAAARFDVIALAATLAGGYPIFKEAVANLVARRMTMELSMTIALAAALAIGEFFTVLVIVLFVLVAEVLEGLTVGRGRRAIKDLLGLLPQQALVRRGGGTQEVGAGEVQVGDVVLVKPGARVPVDGVVVAGNSFVDQAPITGESLPVEKRPGSSAYAGTINQSGVIEVRTEGIGRDTAFGKIIEAVERAEQSRAPIQKTADRLAGYLVYFAIGCAALTFLVTRDVRSTISVVIVAGACGIAAGTPLAVLGGIGRAARQGAIIKGGLYLEALGTVDTIVLDKTGTLTLGNPEVTGVHPWADATPEGVVRAAAVAETRSEHPLAKAVLRKAAAMSLPVAEPERFEYVPGKGIACSLDGERIVVGSRAFLQERRWTCPRLHLLLAQLPKCSWVGTDACWGRCTLRTLYDRRRCRRWLRCARWGFGRCCSPATPRPSPRRSASGWGWTMFTPDCCPTRRWRRSGRCGRRESGSPWWETGSTTPRPWPKRASAWRWGRAPTWPVRAPTWCCWATTC